MWETKDGKLHRRFNFKDFIEAFAFLSKVALISERINHHPEIRSMYNVVDLYLYTEDQEDTITEKDRHLADRIDQVFKSAILA
jgi:4a-hydroxytetrahydrobiopterin dehydratase